MLQQQIRRRRRDPILTDILQVSLFFQLQWVVAYGVGLLS